MNEYEIVVDNFVKAYDDHLPMWQGGQNYFSSESSPESIRLLTETLSRNFSDVFRNPYIQNWRSTEEWPESMTRKIVYSIVNLLIHQNDRFLPHDIKQFILKQPIPPDDPDYRLNVLDAIYSNVYSNIPTLQKTISSSKQPVEPLGPELLSLYGEDNTEYIYLFSGVKEVVFSNKQLYDFLHSTPHHDFPLRSWTVDLRVAMQFTSSDDSTSRFYGRLSRKLFRVILITKQREICYVSPYEATWEAEVLIPGGTYICGGYFFKELSFYNPPYHAMKEPKQFLFVIIEKINEQPSRIMNQSQYNRYIKSVHDRFLKDQKRIRYDSDDDSDDEAEEYTKQRIKTFKAMLRYNKKKKKQKKQKQKKRKHVASQKKKKQKKKKKKKQSKSKHTKSK
jgi:hypothetical protein